MAFVFPAIEGISDEYQERLSKVYYSVSIDHLPLYMEQATRHYSTALHLAGSPDGEHIDIALVTEVHSVLTQFYSSRGTYREQQLRILCVCLLYFVDNYDQTPDFATADGFKDDMLVLEACFGYLRTPRS